MLSEVNQTEEDKQCMISPICGISTHTHTELIDTEDSLLGSRGGDGGVGKMGKGYQKVQTSSSKIKKS